MGGSVIDPAKWLLNLAGSLTAPIFSRGKNIATLKAAKLAQQQALNNFQYSILNASAEVRSALVDIATYREKQVNVNAQRECLTKAVEFNQDLMNLANATYLEVISAQQSLLQAQIQLENVKLNNNLSVINLYQVLGGGR
jgi:outer membrane protein TolC